MSGSWQRTFSELPPDAVQILRVMTLLDLGEMTADELAATVPLGLPETTAAVEVLRRTGWMRNKEPSAECLADDARRWLTETATVTAAPDQAAALADRLITYHLIRLDAGQRGHDAAVQWASDHRTSIIAAIRAATTAGVHTAATRLAIAAWQVADRVTDASWWRELVRHGENAAIQGRDEVTLIALLSRSAAVFADAGDEVTAEEQWVRALRLADERGDHDRTVAVLTALGGLYRTWDRLDRALDTWVELVDELQHDDDPVGLAGALAEVGATMLAADRPGDAPTYLSRADALLTEATPAEVSAVLHARVLELWGRALWVTDQRGAARRRFHRALALLVDVDDAAADRVRTLLATDTDAPLPDEPGESG